MSRKDYVEVAEILATEREYANDEERTRLANVAIKLALMFKRDNPRFNAGKFFEAAGFPELADD